MQPQRNRSSSSAPGFKLWLACSDYRTIDSQSKDLLMRIIRAVRYQSKSDHWSDLGYSQLMDFTTEERQKTDLQKKPKVRDEGKSM